MKWVVYAGCMGEMRNADKILIGKAEGKRSLGRPIHGWEDDIKMYLREMTCDYVYWIQGRGQ
jgi:hypothetical protein